MTNTEHSFFPFSTLPDLLYQRADTCPDLPAIEAPGCQVLTYRNLWEQITYVASYLQTTGVNKEDRVALLLPNGPEMAVAFLAATSIACAAPLNPAYRIKELEFYFSDLRPRVLLVHSALDTPARDLAPSYGAIVIELDASASPVAGIFGLSGGADAQVSDRPNEIFKVRETSEALVLHTSGTTSRPKQVPLSHANIALSATNIVRTLDLRRSECSLNVMPLFHIHGLVAGLVAPLAAGGRVVCTGGLHPDNFLNWLETYRPAWYSAVPTMHQTILEEAKSHSHRLANSPLRFIRSSSAALPPGIMQELETLFQCPVIEAYGMTEATHQMTSNPLPPGKRKPGSVGLPAGPEVAIMKEDGGLLVKGEKGEIVIRGGNVMAGYAGNAEANRRSFHNGWFRTGDEGQFDADGYLFITGRLKEIINRGGENIQPREIDEALMELPEVRQAVAFAVPHPTLGEDIAAAVVVSPESGLTGPVIREFAFGRLAGYKVPSEVLIVDEIPKGSTGKLQRLGLANLLSDQLGHHYVAPRNDLERTVAEVFAEVLGLDRIGVNDNFFTLGGDSISGTQVIGRLQTVTQVELPIVTLFHKPTVAELSEYISESADPVDSEAVSEILAMLETLTDEEAAQLLLEEVARNRKNTGKG